MRVVLCSIVRNEERVIRRMLDSVRGVVDALVVTDTGSTDATVGIISEWAAEAGLPFRILSDTWKDFGHNRTLSLRNARTFAIEYFGDSKDVYALLLDADHCLVHEGRRFEQLTAPAYLLLQSHGHAMQYYNTRLIRMDRDVRCIGVTHEYWDVAGGERYAHIRIDDRGDGGCKDNKFERDYVLLKNGLLEEPGNPRYTFYLAETCRNSKRLEEALQLYDARANMRHAFEEERWYAMFMGAEVAKMLNHEHVLDRYLRAWEARPHRNEPLVAAAELCLNAYRHELAWLLIGRALRNGVPTNDLLFVDIGVHTHRPRFQESICGFYLDDAARTRAGDACEWLLRDPIGRSLYFGSVQSNWQYYAQPLSVLRRVTLDDPHRPVGYAPCNPSIVQTDDGYCVALRTVNYTIDRPTGRYLNSTRTAGIRFVHTITMIQKRGPNMELRESRELMAPPLNDVDGPHLQGMEDVRMALHPDGSQLLMSGTMWDPVTYKLQISHCVTTLATVLSGSEAVQFTPATHTWTRDCEKNWLPFWTDEGAPAFIYQAQIDGACKVTDLDGTMTEHRSTWGNAYDHLRGSAGPIRWRGGRLVVTHELSRSDAPRLYLHRFLLYDDAFALVSISKPFYFQQRGIEFACGMALGADESVWLTYGTFDAEAAAVQVHPEVIAAMLTG